jgi:kinesin family protein 4/21/27
MQRKREVSDKGDDNSPVLLDYNMRASFLEVYGEDVFDLLDADRRSLPLREDSDGGVVIAGLTSRPISNPAEALQVLHEGTMNRTTAATLMNLTSSRSHAVFTIHLTQVVRSRNCEEVDVTSISKFTFVDLAGSERMKKTGAEGERAREGIKINEGLLALGNVINALADEERLAKEKKIHVPYRQSKLTRLLQDALGGNSQTLFLACVSPSDTNASETLSTMHYANRARNIRNAPTKNVDATAAELQRLNTLTHILQCELIKSRFQGSGDGEEAIGHIDDELMERRDVEEYIRLIHQRASEMSDSGRSLPSLNTALEVQSKPIKLQIQSATSQPMDDSMMVHVLDATPNKTLSERFDDSFLVDVNPDEDMAILDQLLELQQHDHEYDKEKKRDDEKLKRMDGELAGEEAMLLQLRESLKVYHSLKEKYEELMAEVQQLEAEKESLADQLEKAKVDPSTGCSAAIKRQLEKVELSLSRARRETLSHRQKYKTAEEQAKKCRVLERKISELKQVKITLVKKQKEAAARYKETTEAKTKELLALRRKEKASEMRMSKLKTEMQYHKTNLEKRKKYCTKLSEKLKQTESHLTKLVAMRQRDLVERTSLAGVGRRKTADFGSTADEQMQENQKNKSYTLSEEEKNSTKFVFNKMVWEKASQAHLQNQYDERVAVYNNTLRKVVSAVKLLNAARGKYQEDKSGEVKEDVQELEASVADLEFQLELLGSELKDIRSKMPQDPKEYILDGDEAVKKIMSTMSTPVLRTMLMETFSQLVGAEVRFNWSVRLNLIVTFLLDVCLFVSD